MSTAVPTVNGVAAADFPSVRERVRPFLENFASRDLDGRTADDFEKAITDRDQQLWVINDFQAVALTQVTTRAVRLTQCAGVRRHEWQNELDDTIRSWGRRLGKEWAVIEGRPGWSKAARARGYRERHREMAVKL